MIAYRRSMILAALAAILLAPVLAACGSTTTPTVPSTVLSTSAPTKPTAQATQIPQTNLPPTPAKAPPTFTPIVPTLTPKGPTVGGTLVWASFAEPPTLDVQKASLAITGRMAAFFGSTLIAIGPDGKYSPYLAHSWKISDDGLTLDFSLRKGVKFHDGTPMTANDFVWSFQRAKNPDTKSPQAGASLALVSSMDAPDDYTFRLKLTMPMFAFLDGLTDPYLQPLPRGAVEKLGDQFGRQPVGVGPFKFKEWQTGQKVVLERNPDFTWGPSFVHTGPAYIQTLEFRIMPEATTVIAGLEAGEIDFADELAGLATKDIPRIRSSGNFQVFEGLQKGMRPYLVLNVQAAPFTDVKVRKALNLAVDRQSLINVVFLGEAVEMRGPLSPSQRGYASIDGLGYGFDLGQAKSLMKDAGYVPGSSGQLEKDGQPLKLTLEVINVDMYVKVGEVLKEQLRALGVGIDLRLGETASVLARMRTNDYSLGLMGVTYGEAEVMYRQFHSSGIGALNFGRVSDPELDRILQVTRTATDATVRQAAVSQAAKYIMDQAYVVPLCAPKNYAALSKRIQGAIFSPAFEWGLVLDDAYVVDGE